MAASGGAGGGRGAAMRQALVGAAGAAAVTLAFIALRPHLSPSPAAAVYRQLPPPAGSVPAAWVRQGVDPGTPLGSAPAPAFTLTDQWGRRFSLASLRGRVVLLAFVDSRSTGYGPLTAETLLDARTLLGRGADALALVGVNTDARACGVASVRAFSRAHGLERAWRYGTAAPSALARVRRAYGVAPGMPAVFLIDGRGRERAAFLIPGAAADVPEQAEVLARAADRLFPRPVPLAPASRLAGGATSGQVLSGGAFRLPGWDARGQAATLTAGRGRAAVVAFFATWCTACRRDLTAVARYSAVARRLGLPPAVAVDLRVAEPSTAYVRQAWRRDRVALAVALDGTGRVADAYGVTALPTLAVVDGRGRILWRHQGALSPAALVRAVAAVLGGGRRP
jgi:cytochrome oxidase Cu insertion factor (SCO1/SenC/PrrC family)/thiol-disulfide isomerase/thioredoxin